MPGISGLCCLTPKGCRNRHSFVSTRHGVTLMHQEAKHFGSCQSLPPISFHSLISRQLSPDFFCCVRGGNPTVHLFKRLNKISCGSLAELILSFASLHELFLMYNQTKICQIYIVIDHVKAMRQQVHKFKQLHLHFFNN